MEGDIEMHGDRGPRGRKGSGSKEATDRQIERERERDRGGWRGQSQSELQEMVPIGRKLEVRDFRRSGCGVEGCRLRLAEMGCIRGMRSAVRLVSRIGRV